VSSTAETTRISAEDYLEGETHSPIKHEYLAGEVFAMAGAGEAHVTVALNLATLLRAHVRGGPCRVYMSDMKVRVEQADAYYYPDVFVTCAESDRAEDQVKHHPTLVVEVLSKSTAAFDRGAKFAHYRQLDSLREYVLIEPEHRAVDVFRRNPEGNWVLYAFTGDEELQLASLDFRCPLAAVYEDVELPR
jgi:Uma2 family endonuclease